MNFLVIGFFISFIFSCDIGECFFLTVQIGSFAYIIAERLSYMYILMKTEVWIISLKRII